MNAIPRDIYGMVWIDVESNPSPGCGWRDANYNCAFLG